MDTATFKEFCAAIRASAVNPSIEEPNQPDPRPAYEPDPYDEVHFELPTSSNQEEFWKKQLLGMRSTPVSPEFMLGITADDYWKACRLGKNDMGGATRLDLKDRVVKKRSMVVSQTIDDDSEVEMVCIHCGWTTCTPDVCLACPE